MLQKLPKGGIVKSVPAGSVRRFLNIGWFLPGDEFSLDRKNLMQYQLTANIAANMIGGNFLAGFLLQLGVDDGFAGLIAVFVFEAYLLQLFSSFVMERYERRKALLIGLKIWMCLSNIVIIGTIPFFPTPNQSRLVLPAVLVFPANAISAFLSPSFTIWHIAHCPEKSRFSFFSALPCSMAYSLQSLT